MTYSYKKRYLPHIEISDSTYFITFNTMQRRILKSVERDKIFQSIHFHNERKYDLIAALVMPDHVHLILSPLKKGEIYYSLSEILHSIKSYSAQEINKMNNEKGSIWQDENYDNIIRDENDLHKKMMYIINNPVKKNLVDVAEEYKWLYVKGFIEKNMEYQYRISLQ